MILTEKEINNKKNLNKIIELTTEQQENYKKYSISDYTSGKFILYEEISNRSNSNNIATITYPKMALIIGFYLCDMAIEVEYIDVRRNWENNVEYEYKHNGQTYTSYASDIKSILKTTIIWDNDLYVYGCWDVMPKFRELRTAYEKTLWFGKTIQEQRDLTIKRILRNG